MMYRILLASLLLAGLNGVLAQAPPDLPAALAPFIDLVVAKDGSGDFESLQAAVNAAPSNGSEEFVIFVRKGEYREKVHIPDTKRHLTLIGEDADSTVIVWDDDANIVVDGEPIGTFKSESIRVDAHDFKAMNLTFENDARPDGDPSKGQNVAMACYGDRSIFLHCRFIAWQDTYYSGSDDRQYFKDCFIEGAVDYIFGHTTVIFDSCQIHTVRSGGYITAASTLEEYQFGYVFFHCNITAPPGISSVYLGRPWKPFARTVFIECTEYDNVSPTGWHVWSGKEETCYYAEYNCSGPGSDTTQRVSWSHQLTAHQAAFYTRENIFSAASSPTFSGSWDPAVDEDTLWSIVGGHTRMFIAPENTDARIAELLVDGEALPGWDPDIHEYSIEMESAGAPMPVLSASAVNPLAEVTISYPEGLPGFSEILVLANDGATHSSYRVYFSVDSSYTNSRLDSIRIANQLLEGFDPDILEYDVLLPAGTSKYFGLTGYAQVDAARVKTAKPAALPGTATLTVTAVDGVSTSTYLLHISLATGLGSSEKQGSRLLLIKARTTGLEISMELTQSRPLQLRLWDLQGRLLAESWLEALSPGRNHRALEIPISPGIYVYTIENQDIRWTGKIINEP